jgi:hypothetical protein
MDLSLRLGKTQGWTRGKETGFKAQGIRFRNFDPVLSPLWCGRRRGEVSLSLSLYVCMLLIVRYLRRSGCPYRGARPFLFTATHTGPWQIDRCRTGVFFVVIAEKGHSGKNFWNCRTKKWSISCTQMCVRELSGRTGRSPRRRPKTRFRANLG